ncbi:MAG: AMP-binding protein [Acidobacteria bacterium 13_1_40CM_65_14]|nr:MAG: AMP-binding protein [Acidobacteria bacterium 13_1_40CM_65_14]
MEQPPYRDVTVGDLLTRLAQAVPSHAALVYADGPRYTFEALDREARTIARGLMALGIEPGERVVLWATNVPEWIVLQFALAKIGAILVTANTSLRSKDIDYLLRQSEAATLVTIRGFRDVDYVSALAEVGAVTGTIPTLKRIIYIGADPPAGYIPYDALRANAAQVSEADLDARSRSVGVDDVINMQYTSGTTGFPKGVMLTSRNIVNNGHALGGMLGFTPADRLCVCVPLFHCFGCVIGVLGAFTYGSCLCVVEAFEPRRVLEMIHRERCTALYGVPTMFIAELECPDFAKYDLTSLRTGVMAGALCPEPLMRRVMTDMHLPEITIAYGMTESSPGITMTPRDSSITQRSQTVGIVLPELEVRIVDPATGAERATGERGELCCRGYNVMKGYYNNPDATRAAIDADEWLHTGDEASMDPDGYVRITGRIKDLIIRGGENIAPKEIEDRLREHAAVADAYVYGVPDAFFGEVVAAAVRLKPDTTRTQEDMISWCGDTLAKFKVPKYVRFVSEFPMTASGKIQKYKLREEHQNILAS